MSATACKDYVVVELEQSVEPDSRKLGLENNHNWHYECSVQEVAHDLDTDLNVGLTSIEADIRLKKNGPNKLSQAYATTWWRDLFSYFTDFFSLLLQVTALLCLIAYLYDKNDTLHLYLSIFLCVVVTATSLFCFIQHCHSDHTLRKIQNFLPPRARVIRDGETQVLVDTTRLVVGDIVVIDAGDRVPADVRVIESNAFAVDNAVLTGKRTPVALTTAAAHGAVLDASNLAFFGCFAVEGSCRGVVVAVGDSTVYGGIARLTAAAGNNSDKQVTALQRDIHHFVVNISVFAFSVGIVCFAIGLYTHTNLVHNVVYTIGIIVSNVPEGLFVTVAVALTASARRMSRNNMLVKRVDAVQTLGSTSVIVTDKTGTLTEGCMSVAHASFGGTVQTVSINWIPPSTASSDIDEKGAKREQKDSRDQGLAHVFEALLHGASVCSSAIFGIGNDAEHVNNSGDRQAVRGNPTEAGVLWFTERVHDTEAYRRQAGTIVLVPFRSRGKFMISADRAAGVERIVMKGAPERVLDSCSSILSVDGMRDMSVQDRKLLKKQVEYFAQRGERVLAYAERILSKDEGNKVFNDSVDEDVIRQVANSTNLCFVGLLSLTDPPRAGVAEAISKCKNAGIRVVMVTGDHAGTALAVAQSIGVVTKSAFVFGRGDIQSSKAVIVFGEQMNELDDTCRQEVLSREEVIFVRATPSHKLSIVNQLQNRGDVVTVTGDGCNDAPALRQSNAGVAMGTSGSDISREAAQIVLLDDNFASVVSGIEEGRLIFDNLKKSVAYTLTSNLPQVVPFMAFVMLGMPLALTTLLVLCIDLITDILPAIALVNERAEHDIMLRCPRKQTELLMNRRLVSYTTLQIGVMQTLAGFLAYFIAFSSDGFAPQSLFGLTGHGYFASTHTADQRWFYAEQRRVNDPAFRAKAFSRKDDNFAEYFVNDLHGFERQMAEQYKSLVPSRHGVSVNDSQFNNMVKIIGHERRRPPCWEFSCQIGDNTVVNSVACFDPSRNTGPVVSHNNFEGSVNNAVNAGSSAWHGCFNLWAPKRQDHALSRAQTSFFAAIVVAKIFTLFACKTRIASVFPRMFDNPAVWFALIVEIALTAFIVYFPPITTLLQTVPLRWSDWWPAVSFGIFILFYDELRKCIIRRHIRNQSDLVISEDKLINRVAKWIHDFTLW